MNDQSRREFVKTAAVLTASAVIASEVSDEELAEEQEAAAAEARLQKMLREIKKCSVVIVN